MTSPAGLVTLVLSLLLGVSCAPAAPAPAPVAPAPAPAPPASSAAPSWSPAPDESARLAESVDVRFILEPAGDGARSLKLVLGGRRTEQRLFVVPSGHRCGVDVATRGDATEASVGCGLRAVARVKREGSSIELAFAAPSERGALFPVHEDTRVTWQTTITDPESGKDCPPGGPSTPLLIRAELGPGRKVEIGPGYRWAPRTLVLSVPAMKIAREVTTIEREFCQGHLDLLRGRYEAGCLSDYGTRSLEVHAEGDSLLFIEGYTGGGGREALGGLAMPCGASPSFEPLWYMAPGYGPPGAACRARCAKPQIRCLDQCDARQRSTGDAAAGESCRERCRAPVERCEESCPR